MKKSLFNCKHSLRRTEPRRHNSGQNKPPIRLGNDKKPFLWGSAAHQEALSVAAQRHSSRPAVKQTLQAAAGKLSSQGQPKKKQHPLPTILLGEREEKQRDGEKREDEREQRRAAGFTASLLTVCVCVWQVLSLLPSMPRGSVRSEVVGGHFLSISSRRIKKRPSSITQHLVAAGNGNHEITRTTCGSVTPGVDLWPPERKISV